MRVADCCKRGVVTTTATADIGEVARTMRDEHVGFVVVVAEGDPQRVPVGVLTDRDIVLKVCARGVAPDAVTAADVMSPKPLVANEADDLSEVLQAMRISGFRRVPVLSHAGGLAGVIAVDDAIDVVAGLMCDICGSIRNEQRQEWQRLGS